MRRTALEFLFRTEPPWIYAGPGEPEREGAMPSYFYSHTSYDVCVRVLRGWKMRTREALMSEFGAALQFADGYSDYGENWFALLDCLRDLDGWLRARAYILVVKRAEEVLRDDTASQLAALLVTIKDAGEYWSKAIADGDIFDRPATPFHLLLNYSDSWWGEAEEQRLREAAAEFGVDLRLPSH